MKLRDYQLNARDATIRAFDDGFSTVAGRVFTGGGKTVICSDIIRIMLERNPDKCALFLAHRQELIWQAVEKIHQHTGLTCDVEMGDHKVSMTKDMFKPTARVIVSSVQTQTMGGADGAGRLSRFNPDDFCLVVVDECHRAVSATWRRLINYYQQNQHTKIVGVTATPDRTDEKSIGIVFEHVPEKFDCDINYGRINGWLVEIDQLSVHVESLDFSKVGSNAEDLNGKDLAAVMEQEKPLYGIVRACMEVGEGRQGIGFSPSVKHAQLTANIFNRWKPGSAAFVHGGTDPEERRMINSKFAQGEIAWIWNCGTHTEGFDCDRVGVIVPKPTKARWLYEQMIGRGTRPLGHLAKSLGLCAVPALRRSLIARSPKPDCLVMDFYGNSGKHKLITAFDILGGDRSAPDVQTALQFARAAGKRVRVTRQLDEEEKKRKEAEARQLEEASKRAKLEVGAKYKMQRVDPFNVLEIKPVVNRGWDVGKKLSEKQANFLRRAGQDPEKLEYRAACQLIGIISDRREKKKTSIGQIDILKKFGYHAQDWNKDAASKVIDAIKANGWQRLQKPVQDYINPQPFQSQEPAAPVAVGAGASDDDVPF